MEIRNPLNSPAGLCIVLSCCHNGQLTKPQTAVNCVVPDRHANVCLMLMLLNVQFVMSCIS